MFNGVRTVRIGRRDLQGMLVAAALVGMIIGVWWSWEWSVRSFEAETVAATQQHLLMIARTQGRNIQDSIREIADDVAFLSNNPDVQLAVRNGTCIASEGVPSSYSIEASVFRLHDSVLTALYRLDSTGQVQCRFPPLAESFQRDYSNRPGILRIISAFAESDESQSGSQSLNGAVVSDVFVAESGCPALSVCAPIVDGTELIGISRAVLSIETIGRMLGDVEAGAKGVAWLQDDKGRLVIQSGPRERPHFESMDLAYPESLRTDGAIEGLVAEVRGKEAGTSVYIQSRAGHRDGEILQRRLAGYTPIKVGDKCWTLVVSMDYDELAGPINGHARKMLFVAVIVLIAVVAAALGVYRSDRRKTALTLHAEANERLKQEIDERERVELALLRSNESLTQLNELLHETAKEIESLMQGVVDDGAFRRRYVNPSMLRCWEELECDKTECPSYGRTEELRCWQTPNTLCHGAGGGDLAEKLVRCQGCEVYSSAREDTFHALGETFNNMMRILEDRQRSLTDALQDAQLGERAKAEFLANMSHEIRTPMTAILGFAENLLDGSISKEERLRYVRAVCRNGEYLLRIIDDILDLSKIEAGRMILEHVPCSPCNIVADVVSLLCVRADEKNLPIFIEYPGPMPETIKSDPTRIRQILINLVGNAVKFTRSGSVRVIPQLQLDEEAMIQFDVVDTGRGMTKKQAERLFEPFVQADATTTREFGGTGLGLAISRRFAQMLGGDISVVKTKEGEGTTFRVTISAGDLEGASILDDPMTHTVAECDYNESHRSATPLFPGSYRILLVEDGEDNQEFIAGVLEKAGANVDIAFDGSIAVEWVDAAEQSRNSGADPWGYDAVLMDMQMPVMDGYEATRRLRENGYSGPIIALTAHAMEGDREKCLEAGCTDYVTKPIKRLVLLRTIIRCLESAAEREGVASI